MIINTLERLFVLVVGAVAMLFVYGMLSMAWAGCTKEKQPDCYEETKRMAVPLWALFYNGVLQKKRIFGTKQECLDFRINLPSGAVCRSIPY